MVVRPFVSDRPPKIEYMFDNQSDSALLGEMAAAQRDERVAVARRLMAAGRLCQVRMSAVEADEKPLEEVRPK